MATAPSPNDLTRQQLDELDGLLQRMLALPLNPPEPAPTPAPKLPEPVFDPPPLPKNWRVDPPAPPVGPAPHLLVTEVPLPDPVPTAPMLEADLAPLRVAATREPEPVAVMSEPALPPPVVVVRPMFEPEPTPAKPEPPLPRPVVGPPTPPLLLPFVALNWLIDRLLGVFGPFAPLLRSGFVKNVFGVAGVGLLLYTAAHVVQARGWVSFPFPLPWPR